MADVVKFKVKDFNPDRLLEELEVAIISPEGMKWRGFTRINPRLYEPNASTKAIATSTGQPDVTADPGELHFKYATDPGAALDTVLDAHDATKLSSLQIAREEDFAAIPALINAWNNWDTFTNIQKDNANRQAQRLIARLLDRGLDI